MTTVADQLFLPAGLDAGEWESVRPFFESLGSRPVSSPAEFERWLLDRSDLDAACSQARANRYIAMTCRTDDPAAAGAWTKYIEETAPKLKPAEFELDKRQTELFTRFPLDRARYQVLDRDARVGVELFRQENVPLETELARLDQRYDEICGAMLVDFEGEQRPMPRMARFQQETDRNLRERAWRAAAERRLQDKEEIESIYDQMVALRHKLAANAGFPDFRAYAFRSKRRFDYTPEHCAAFHQAAQECVVPFLHKLDQRRRSHLGLSRLRPWDLGVEERGRPPLRPFETGQQLVEQTRRVYDRIDPELASMFRDLGDNMQERPGGVRLDLDSRKGKASGGYQYARDRDRTSFIFMNAAGMHGDVHTMVHEAGHMFHSQLSRDEPLVGYRHSPIEFAEVASMSQELLTMPEWNEYYADPAQADRARREQLEGSISLLAWIAQIDAFQHWVYLNPGHTREQRRDHWLALDARFGRDLDWSGLEHVRGWVWHRQSHLFGSPFYYIEYGIAQLGALGLWLHSLERGRPAALALYKKALTLGGSRPLPELFAAAGLKFDFGPGAVRRLVAAVESELAKLPE